MSGEHRPEPPFAASPVQMTAAFHDFLRETLIWKTEGLTEEEVRRELTPSGLSLVKLIKHSIYVERSWISRVFAGLDVEVPWSEADPDADWRIEPDETLEGLIALYRAEAEQTRRLIAGQPWETPAKVKRRDEVHTLGWILCHMIEEVGRHCGHADVLREAIDGATGE